MTQHLWGYPVQVVLYDIQGRRLHVDAVRINHDTKQINTVVREHVEVDADAVLKAMEYARERGEWGEQSNGRETPPWWWVDGPVEAKEGRP